MTVGLDESVLEDGALGAIGLDFPTWTETSGLSTSSGAVYVVNPEEGATVLPCPIAQLTVREGTTFSGRLNAQGKLQAGEWVARDLEFSEAGGVSRKAIAQSNAPPAAGSGH